MRKRKDNAKIQNFNFTKKIYKEEQTLIEPKHVQNLAWNIVILNKQ